MQPVVEPGSDHFSDDPSSFDLSLTTLILLCVKLLSFHATQASNSFMGDFSPSGSTPDGGLRNVVIVSNIFWIGNSSSLGMFVRYPIPHYPAVAWTPSEGYLVPFVMEGSKEV